MEKEQVTIVTGFFDIGRDKFKGEFARSNQKYIDFFEFWARIKNNMIIYTDTDTAAKALKIRENYGLKDKTQIVIIDDFFSIEPEIINRMRKVASDETFLKFRYMSNIADNNADYDYIMMLKSWCLKDASTRNLANGMLCWIDFGFNQGGKLYPVSEEFDFELTTDFPKDKITFFGLKNDDFTPIFKIVQNYDVYIMGFLIYVHSSLAETLWEDIKEAMNSLLDVGFLDDDQTLMLMVSRKYKDRYNVVQSSDWLMPIKEHGGEHLTVIKQKNKISFKDKVLKRYRVNKRNRQCMKNMKELFWKK